MCEKLQCYPNLWALHEWANWLTPTFFPSKFRYNVSFFFTHLPQIPILKPEATEVEEIMVIYLNLEIYILDIFILIKFDKLCIYFCFS